MLCSQGTGYSLFYVCNFSINSKAILTKITNQPKCRRNRGNFLIALLLNTYFFFFWIFLLKGGPQCSQLLIREEAARTGAGPGEGSGCGQGHNRLWGQVSWLPARQKLPLTMLQEVNQDL